MSHLLGTDWGNKVPVGGRYVADADDDTANAITINTGVINATVFFVQIFRSGANVLDAAVVTLSAGVLTITDGGTYAATTADVVNWLVI